MQNLTGHLSETGKTWLDFSAVGIALASLASWLPPLAALAALIWTCLRIWEIVRVRGWWRVREEEGSRDE
jgi:hypothetical protein